jgi:SAM-dependent methyltransferase
MRSTAFAADAYSQQGHDAVRASFEMGWFAARLPALLCEAGGGEVLDLGCGDGTAARLVGCDLERYVGVDLAPGTPRPASAALPQERGLTFIRHDLRSGLGPVGTRPFDLYLGTFGIASHLSPRDLGLLLLEIAAHARPGALVALEALGLRSLEWPQLWDRGPGPARALAYRMASDVIVHPWAPAELFGVLEACGIRPLWAADRTVQAAPKLGEGRYWPGLPDVRAGLNALLEGTADDPAVRELGAPLPPLPAGPAARVHHAMAERRARLLRRGGRSASAIWHLEPRTAGGFGHGLFVVGRVPG